MTPEEVERLRADTALGCRILARANVSPGILGHVSARLDGNRMLIRCRGPQERGLLFTTIEDIQVVGLDGSGDERDPAWRRPSELPIHGELLRARPDVMAVVHAHPPAALVAALAGLELRPVFGAYNIPAMRLALDGVPVFPRAALITRPDLAGELIACMGDRPACLMRGHGITVTGASVAEAVVRALDLEQLAAVTRDLALLGATAPVVSDADLAEIPDLGGAFNIESVWRMHAALDARG